MKKTSILFGIFAVVAFAVSCQTKVDVQDDVVIEPQGEVITITADLSNVMTKVTFTPGTNGSGKDILELAWKSGDKLRVYNHDDHASYSDFTLDDGSIGQKKGIFSGSPVAASAYDVEVYNAAMDYAAQSQPADGDASGLQYNASVENIAELSDIVFTDVSSVLLFTAKNLPSGVAATIKSVSITASEAIFNGGNSLTVTLDAEGDAGSDNTLKFYATLPKGDKAIPAGTSMLVKFNATSGDQDVYTRYFTTSSAVTLTSGSVNEISVGCANVKSHAGAATSDGSNAAKAYLIGDKYQMAAITDKLSTTQKKYFKLVDNLTLSSWSNIDCDTNGAIDLDGNGKTITGLTAPVFSFLDGRVSNLTITDANISASSSNYYGVLARTVSSGKECELENITIKNSQVTAKGTVGGMIGRIDNSSSTLTNCSADVEVTGTAYYVAGLVGKICNGTVTHCSATGKVYTSTHYAGGLIGLVENTVSVQKCYSTCDIEPTAGSTANHGGIVAHTTAAATLTVKDCYSTGQYGTDTYKTRRWCGGILGTTASGSTISVTNCYSTSTRVSANIGLEGALVGNNGCTNLTCSGFVGWSTLAALAGAGTAVSADGNYLGQGGTVLSQATTLGWDFSTIWNSVNPPTLK